MESIIHFCTVEVSLKFKDTIYGPDPENDNMFFGLLSRFLDSGAEKSVRDKN